MSDIYNEMETLEMEDGEGTLIPGLPPPPTNPATNIQNETPPAPPTRQTQRRNGSAIANPPRRSNQTNPTTRRCLIHLVVRCPICFRTPHHRNPRFFRQEGIRAIITLIREVFGVNLHPRELALFIAGYYA